MLRSFDKLNRMLTQEKRLGYKNKTVMGGFEKFAPNWKSDAKQETSSEPLLAVIDEVEAALVKYPEVADEERPGYVHKILVKLYKAEQTVAGKEQPQRPKQDQAKPEASAPSSPPPREKPKPKLDKPERKPNPPHEKQPKNSQANSEKAAEPKARDNQSAAPAKSDTPLPKQDKRSQKSAKSNSGTATKTRSRSSAKPITKPRPRPSQGRSYDQDPKVDFTDAGLNSPVTKLPGIKDAMAGKLAKLGVETVGDFLYLYPRRYDDYRNLKTINRLELGDEVTIIAQVWETRKRETRNRRVMVTSTLSDGTATIDVTWFNQPWLVDKLKPGTQIVLSGKVDQYLGRLTFQSPEWEEVDTNLLHTGRMVPVYPLTQGITAKWLRKHVKSAVDYWSDRVTDYLPVESRERLKMPPLSRAIKQVHFPDDWEHLEAARRRLAFDELLLIQLGVLRQRQAWQAQPGQAINVEVGVTDRLLGALPFELTGAQRKALAQITGDLQKDVPMSRLLQGDVGSGKTVVALAAMILAVMDGGQAAMLAPTEILAEQHFKGMSKLLEPIGQALGRPISIALLTGSTTASDRQELLTQLAAGQIDLIVGTHAIIQGDVEMADLRLAVIDEQHRFGVGQRGDLRSKGFNPHMLVMTATPIPRTLALTVYGDLDLSIIDELPPGRQIIRTRWVTPRERERAYQFINAQIAAGRQAFVVCPLVEESEKMEAKSAIEEHKRLQTEVFPRLKLGLLHGRMKSDEKDKVMTAFRDGETQILVSTSVVEVGIDIPNASVILIEGANRFGLAQLHQFRGRVGRGGHKSYCLLLADKVSQEVEQRLKAVEETSDGFKLAEKDLEIRGPGEFFGTRQSGLPDLKLVKITDTRLLALAREEAEIIFKNDPHLEKSEHRGLVRQLEQFWQSGSDLS